ncbi:MAG: NUDIX domain-containing protein [Paludibacteraceae bacterium]|nr:NUDIX domain-containing protein [Paludibacteraceae bacterium]
MQQTEWFPIVTETGERIGKATRKECHSGSFLLHPVVHLHVFNAKKQLFLQQRAANKDIQPNKWDTAVGGHVDDGESIQVALVREAYEELKIKDFSANFLFQYPFRSQVEHELVHSFWVQYDFPIQANLEEIQDARFWEIDDIKNSLGKQLFTPNFEDEFTKLLSHPDIIQFLHP